MEPIVYNQTNSKEPRDKDKEKDQDKSKEKRYKSLEAKYKNSSDY